MKLLTVEELTKVLGVSKPIIYELVHTPKFPCMKIGRAWRFDEELIHTWVKERSLA